jgi:3-oxoacyl-[acyl-carrier-protein] synthase II
MQTDFLFLLKKKKEPYRRRNKSLSQALVIGAARVCCCLSRRAIMRDHLNRPIIVITGLGVITSLGAGKNENWAKLTKGVSGIHTISRFPSEGLRTRIGGSVDFIKVDPFTATNLSFALAEIATDEAIQQAKIGSMKNFPGPLVIAVPPIEVEWPQREDLARLAAGNKESVTYDDLFTVASQRPAYYGLFMFANVAERIAERFGTKGSPISLSTACASGATAIQTVADALRRGECEAGLAVATDGSIQPEGLIRFSLLSALSTQNDPPEAASKPFSKNRDGFVIAEGGAALVLETYEHAKARGAEILGYLAGCGEQADSFHRTRSNPNGKAIVGAIQRALDDAGLAPGKIDYINAHGTSTSENDRMEYVACADVFGERMAQLPISSNKSMIGHTLTAAGAVEAVVSLLTLQHQLLPPTINYHVPDPALPLDVVPFKARSAKIETVMSNSFGFGGQNASLIFTHQPVSITH